MTDLVAFLSLAAAFAGMGLSFVAALDALTLE